PGLRIEHVEREVLILHAQVDQLGIRVKEHALVQVVRIQAVVSLQAQIVRQKRKVKQVARTHDDSVEPLAGAILEVRHVAVQPDQQWALFYALWPVIPKRVSAMTQGNRLRTIFVTLGSDVLGRVTATDQQ